MVNLLLPVIVRVANASTESLLRHHVIVRGAKRKRRIPQCRLPLCCCCCRLPVILREDAESINAVYQFAVVVVCLSFCAKTQNPSMLFSNLLLLLVVVCKKIKKPYTYIKVCGFFYCCCLGADKYMTELQLNISREGRPSQ
jgi:hypothetical protein